MEKICRTVLQRKGHAGVRHMKPCSREVAPTHTHTTHTTRLLGGPVPRHDPRYPGRKNEVWQGDMSASEGGFERLQFAQNCGKLVENPSHLRALVELAPIDIAVGDGDLSWLACGKEGLFTFLCLLE